MAPQSKVRTPAVSGAFYPASREALSKMVRDFLASVPPVDFKGSLIALMVPHAGYPYSGQVAAYAYKLLSNKAFDSVILVGSSHHFAMSKVGLYPSGSFEVPTGTFPIDEELASALMEESDYIEADFGVHLKEHSLEVQLPFLRETLGEVKIVPVLTGLPSLAISEALGLAMARQAMKRKTLILASTDLSHYYSYDKAIRLDSEAIEAIKSLDVRLFAEKVNNRRCELCGTNAVLSTMISFSALGANEAVLLKYANSGDVTGDRSRVVGYASMAFLKV